MKAFKTLATAAALLMGAASAQADLVDRGGGLVYDTTLNITWLADMNYARTSGYAAARGVGPLSDFGTNVIWTTGHMGWGAAKAWANDLVYGGFDDWRLASVNPGDTSCSNNINAGRLFPLQYYGYDCTGGELGHLFIVDLGNRPDETVQNHTGDTAQQIANLALFSNAQADFYWADQEFAPNVESAWWFSSVNGSQNFNLKSQMMFAMAVRSGDVAASVPEPGVLALMMMSWGAAAVARKRRSRRGAGRSAGPGAPQVQEGPGSRMGPGSHTGSGVRSQI